MTILARHAILLRMVGDAGLQPVQIVLNYWEYNARTVANRIDELLRSGVSSLCTFVPWQAVESDISHSLVKFINIAAEKGVNLTLILTPEPGIHFHNSGIPRDLLARPEGIAKQFHDEPVSCVLPPNIFQVPSLFSPEFTKRFSGFLSRVDAMIAEVSRSNPAVSRSVTAMIGGSFWKMYRSAAASGMHSFGGPAGDHSNCASLAFRQRIEQFFSQREFADPSPAAANRWKSRQLEHASRKWFNQHSEEFFRTRSLQCLRRSESCIRTGQMEIHTPEADPAYAYSELLRVISGGNADLGRLSSMVDHAAERMSHAGGNEAPSFVHLTGLGPFRSLADAEKQFLVLKSLILMGSRGGGVLIDDCEWLGLSQLFRARAEALGRTLFDGTLKMRTKALYVVPHLWSAPGKLWNELAAQSGATARIAANPESAALSLDASLLVADPDLIITQDAISRIIEWARGGRLAALPRTALYTESARAMLDQLMSGSGGLDLNIGTTYRIQPADDGRIVLFDVPEHGQLARFTASLLSLAGIPAKCAPSDARLQLVPLDRDDGGLGLFILNSTGRKISADVFFPAEVTVCDMASYFTSQHCPSEDMVAPADRFTLEVPPCGVLPLAVDGLGLDVEERKAAAVSSRVLEQKVTEAAENELPGLAQSEDMGALWN